MPKYVLFYESADDVRSKAPVHFAAHVARWKEFQGQGTLLMIGTFVPNETAAHEAGESAAREAQENAGQVPTVP